VHHQRRGRSIIIRQFIAIRVIARNGGDFKIRATQIHRHIAFVRHAHLDFHRLAVVIAGRVAVAGKLARMGRCRRAGRRCRCRGRCRCFGGRIGRALNDNIECARADEGSAFHHAGNVLTARHIVHHQRRGRSIHVPQFVAIRVIARDGTDFEIRAAQIHRHIALVRHLHFKFHRLAVVRARSMATANELARVNRRRRSRRCGGCSGRGCSGRRIRTAHNLNIERAGSPPEIRIAGVVRVGGQIVHRQRRSRRIRIIQLVAIRVIARDICDFEVSAARIHRHIARVRHSHLEFVRFAVVLARVCATADELARVSGRRRGG